MKELTKARRMLWLFGIFKIPLIGFVRPKLVELSEERMVIKVPLRRRTKNHLGSMYFGALAIGADLSGAFQAFLITNNLDRKISIVFKNFSANFIKRPEGDVFFVSKDGALIKSMVDEAMLTKERVTKDIRIVAQLDANEGSEPVAEFALGLSLKDKST